MSLTTESIEVMYHDSHVLVVNKPPNVLSVPGKGPEKKDCVVRRAQQSFPTARIVHRLDCATSGLMVLALDADTHRALSQQFHDRQVAKVYQAIVEGSVAQDQGKVEQPLLTDWPNRPRQIVTPEGKKALTEYQVLSKHIAHTRLKLVPQTGRTHQLRVHMQWLGHPILGDALYHPKCQHNRLHLHAERLGFAHPHSGKALAFNSEVPF